MRDTGFVSLESSPTKECLNIWLAREGSYRKRLVFGFSWNTGGNWPLADQKGESKPGGEKGSFELVPGTTVRPGQEGFVVMDPSGKNTLPLRHSLAEHQQAWMKNIQDAIAGTLGPGPEVRVRPHAQSFSPTETKSRQNAAVPSVACPSI